MTPKIAVASAHAQFDADHPHCELSYTIKNLFTLAADASKTYIFMLEDCRGVESFVDAGDKPFTGDLVLVQFSDVEGKIHFCSADGTLQAQTGVGALHHDASKSAWSLGTTHGHPFAYHGRPNSHITFFAPGIGYVYPTKPFGLTFSIWVDE